MEAIYRFNIACRLLIYERRFTYTSAMGNRLALAAFISCVFLQGNLHAAVNPGAIGWGLGNKHKT